MKYSRQLLVSLLLFTAGACYADGSDDFNTLLDEHWEWRMASNPVLASSLGDRRYNDQWADNSLAAIEERHDAAQDFLRRVYAINRYALSDDGQLNYELFRRQLQDVVDQHQFKRYLMPFAHRGGIQSLDTTTNQLRLQSTADFDDWLLRLEKVDDLVDATIAMAERGRKSGYMAPKILMQRVPDQLALQVVEFANESPFFAVFENMPETIVLAVTSILIATILGIFLGVVAAVKKGSVYDNFALVLSALGISGPSFFVGIIIAWVFGYILTDYTGLDMTGSLFTMDDYGNGEYLELRNLVLPAITLGIRPLSIVVQLTRSSLLDVLSQDYIRTAKAKGLGYYTVIIKHALKNALNPVVTAVSGWFAGLLAGAVFVEYVFNWKGIGYIIVDALNTYDFPVVMGTVLVITTLFVLLNILVDISYGMLDPRVRIR